MGDNQSRKETVQANVHDIRYAIRLIRRQPTFAALVISTLTLGIGATTSIFAVVNGVLLKPLAYADPAALVWMYGAFRATDSAAVSPPDFLDYRARNEVFDGLGAMQIAPASLTISGDGEPLRVQASRVSAALFTTLGVAPALGRDFAPDDEHTGTPAVIISDRVWRERFGGTSDVLGRSMTVDDRVRTVVGVMPRGFTLPYDSFIRLTEPVDLYLPIPFDHPELQVRRFHSLRLIGRLKPLETLERAQAQMDVIARQLAAAYPENETWHLRLVPLHERIVGAVRPVLLILAGSVGLLLLVSCANVASLLLARASAREGELAVRGALGASRGRIVRQQMVEGLALATAGAACALIVTWWTIASLRRFGPAGFPRLDAIAFEPRIIVFALTASAVTTIVFALAPALSSSRGGRGAFTSARTATADRTRLAGQRALVVGQLAVSIVMLALAAVLVRGFVRLVSTETGFTSTGVLIARVSLPDRYDTDARIDAYFASLLERLQATAGIEAAAIGTSPPLVGANDTSLYRAGHPPASRSDQRFAQTRWIAGDYFQALGIPLVAGRFFDPRSDGAGGPPALIISSQTAREHFGSEPAVGQRLVVDVGDPLTAEVIGVVGDIRTFGQADAAPPMVYLHARQYPVSSAHVIVRSALETADVQTQIRRHVQGLDPSLAVSRIDRMETLLVESVAQPRFAMLLIGAFAVLATALTLIGLYGTLAYLVSRRGREIGIRLAVGATRRDITQLFARQGLALVGLGIPLGACASLLTSRVASSLLPGVERADAGVLAAVASLLALISFAAVIVPARRASRIDPLETLRSE